MNITLTEPPQGFLRFSMAISAVVAVSWWVNYELTPVMTAATTFLPIYLLMMTARAVLVLAFCGACFGIGMGSFASTITCFRYLNQQGSRRTSVRYSRSCFAIIVALIIFTVTYGIGIACIGASNLFAYAIMFAGLQICEFFLLHRILSRRQTKAKVQGR